MKDIFENFAKTGAGKISFSIFILPVLIGLVFAFSSCGHDKPPVAETTSVIVTTEEATTEEPTTEEPMSEIVTMSENEISIRAERESYVEYLQSIDEYDQIIDIGYDAGREAGYEEGYRDGYRDGYDDGYYDGSENDD